MKKLLPILMVWFVLFSPFKASAIDADNFLNIITDPDFEFWADSQEDLSNLDHGEQITKKFIYSKSGDVMHSAIKSAEVPPWSTSGHQSKYSLGLNVFSPESNIDVGDFSHISYSLSGRDYQRIHNNKYILSFWVKSSKPGFYSVFFTNGMEGADTQWRVEGYSIAVANTWEKIFIPLQFDSASDKWNLDVDTTGLIIGFTLSAGDDHKTSMVGSWQDASQNALKLATINQSNFSNDPTFTFNMSQVMFNKGVSAADFYEPPVASESPPPLKQKGEIYTHNGTSTIVLPPGSNGQVLTADSNVLNGVKWTSPSLDQIDTKALRNNIMLNAFRIAVAGNLSKLNMQDGVMDEFEDDTGINQSSGVSENYVYDAFGDFFTRATPTTGPGGIDAFTKLLIHSDSIDGSTTFIDSTSPAHTVSSNGEVHHSTSQQKWMGSSMEFDGVGDILSIADHSDWNVVGEDFTVDAWFRVRSTGKFQTIVGQMLASQNCWLIGVSTDDKIYTLVGDGIQWDINTYLQLGNEALVAPNQWHHIALTKENMTWRTFLDGKLIHAGTSTWVNDNNGSLTIGSDARWGRALDGFIDEVRFSHGIARWTSDFTPPTEPYGQPTQNNMTLVSIPFAANAEESSPESANILLFEEDLNVSDFNTDIKAFVSKNGGTSFDSVPILVDEGDIGAGMRILSGEVDLAGTGKQMVWKVETKNNSQINLHGVALEWK